MKRRFALLILSTLASGMAYCQEAPAGAGFLNVVNLVTLHEPTRIELGGFAFNGGEAIPPGESTGVIAILPGTHTLVLSNPAAKPASMSAPLTIEDGKTVAVICYDEVKESKEGSRESKLRYSVLVEGDGSKGPRLSLVSLLKDDQVAVSVSGQPVTLAARQAHPVAVKVGDKIAISGKKGRLTEVEIEKASHYVCFLFENPDSGELEISMIQNERLEYQPPLEADGEGKEKKKAE